MAPAAAAALAASHGAWGESLAFGGLWFAYVFWGRLSRCGVETNRHTPCRWRVRGLFGTCTYHVGDKRGLPVLTRAAPLAMPRLMWRRADLGAAGPVPQPTAAAVDAGTPARARRPTLDRAMAIIALASLLVAVAGFVRDLVAGS